MRKSRREKENEAAEAKKREEEAQAARAYAEFVDAFQGDDAARRKKSAFVKAGSDGTEYAPLRSRETSTSSARVANLDRVSAHPFFFCVPTYDTSNSQCIFGLVNVTSTECIQA